MAYDKVVDSAILDADITTIADAIRAKTGGTDTLSFPTGMAEAIASITGGGSTFAYIYSGDYLETTNEEDKTVIRLNTSGKLTVTAGKQSVNAFLQAGGGGGGCYYAGSSYKSAGGGGGGYDTTQVFLTEGSEYDITIGSGGAGDFKSTTTGGTAKGVAGGDTIAFNVTCTGGGGANVSSSSPSPGAAGTPNGEKGTYSGSKAGSDGGAPNGGQGTASAANNGGGDGYVELTFV